LVGSVKAVGTHLALPDTNQFNGWPFALAALPASQGGAMAITEKPGAHMNAAVAAYAVPRTFAELPYTHSWLKICQHAERLGSVEITDFDTNVEGTWLRFAYGGYFFSIGEFGSRIQLTVNDADSPPNLLVEVTEHFASLLSPHMRHC
jgi:hypothetical protein